MGETGCDIWGKGVVSANYLGELAVRDLMHATRQEIAPCGEADGREAQRGVASKRLRLAKLISDGEIRIPLNLERISKVEAQQRALCTPRGAGDEADTEG